MERQRIVGWTALGMGILLLLAAGWVFIGGGWPFGGDGKPGGSPMAGLSLAPSFTPYVPPSLTPLPEGVTLRVTCNGSASVRLVDSGSGKEIASDTCIEWKLLEWSGLRPGNYDLFAYSASLDVEMKDRLSLQSSLEEVEILFPGVLAVLPVPDDAEVDVEGEIYEGEVRLSYPAAQCPFTATVWVRAVGYASYGRDVEVRAGRESLHEIALSLLPTSIPPPVVTPHPTPRPTTPQTAVTPLPTVAPFTVPERVALVRQKLYEKVNCWRAEGGMEEVPYVYEWQELADEFARAWRDHFLQYGPEGFDTSPWRSQFEAAGGDAVTDRASRELYAPDYYVNLAPATRWESFDMCDSACPAYWAFSERGFDELHISGVVIGMAPWWDGDILNAAVIIAVKW
jgi:hypothetical protein